MDGLYMLDAVALVFRLFLYITWFAVGLRAYRLLTDIEHNRLAHKEEEERRKARAAELSGLKQEDLV